MVVNKMGYGFSGMTIRCHNGASWVTGLVILGGRLREVSHYVKCETGRISHTAHRFAVVQRPVC